METSVDAIELNPFVCVQRVCGKCDLLSIGNTVPGDCPFAIFHALETLGGIKQMRRRTGKTTSLIEMGAVLCQMGYQVYYVAPSAHMAEYAGRMMVDKIVQMPNGNASARFSSMHISYGKGEVMFVSVRSLNMLRGSKPGLVLADDLSPEELQELKRVMVGSRLVAAYYTLIPS